MRDFPFPVSAATAAHFEAWTAAPGEPPPPKLAATVLLLRDADAGAVEVFMQRRVASMAFAARKAVFPGGSVDPGDREELPWSGPPAADWAAALGIDRADAAALIAAAIRELFEEAGVLLAGPAGGGDGRPAAEWLAQERGRILAREATIASVLRDGDLVARTDLLGFHAHWITPEVEPRRYDTFFFTALCPPGQHADDQTPEAESAEWIDPAAMLRDERPALMPPTIVCLEDVAAATSAAGLVRMRRDVQVIQPVPVRHGDGWAMRMQARP
ncbi:MAG: NUDIX domain-containing protein [Actinobacteria bacterium]|nr:NUDIX domain-containing protein [Actinomycetota bacterium]